MTMTRMWNVIGAISVLLILLLGYVVGIAPALASASAADDGIASVELQNQVKANELAAFKALAEDSDQLFADLAEVQVAVPGIQESSQFARELGSLAAAAGVQLDEVSYSTIAEALAPEAEVAPAAPADAEGEPGTETDGTTTEPAAPAGPQAIQSVPGLVSVGVSIRAAGPLASVTKFLNSVQLHQRAFSVSSTAIRVGGETDQFELTLEGSVYVLTANRAPIASPTDSGEEVN